MRKEKVILQNETGLHARPASELAKLAGRFKCDINLSVNEKSKCKINFRNNVFRDKSKD